ncbi:MAG: Hemolysin-type calcium-binding region [Solirubrobacterales bacterium]|nr:Hemolysin-type calcium-binding region [Solirubrobacterales bacterium]
MHRLSIRRALRVLLVSCVAVVAGGTGTALATTVAYSGDGTTLIVTGGDNAAHGLQFRLSADHVHDEILDDTGFTTIPADCTVVSGVTWISCPYHLNVQVVLGAGNDSVTFGGSTGDCFLAYAIDLGDGTNTLHLNENCDATPETATVTSGSGQDTLSGGNQATTTFSAGGGDDNVYAGTGDDTVHGGDGNDRLFGASGNDQLLGEGGNDDVDGGAGNDLIDGGAGNDRLEYSTGLGGNDTGAGADTYIGGADADLLELDNHTGGIAISINGVADDGSPGEGDNVGSDIESIDGSRGNDVFTGSAANDTFNGGSGNDEIHGGGGGDDLYGGGGDDRVYGEAGNDKLQGANGSDIVDGGPGVDQIYGDIGSCSFSCTADADQLFARDGEKDAVDCGGGADSAQVDFDDVVAFCASVDRSAASGAGAGAGGGGGGGGGTVGPPPALPGPTLGTLGTLGIAKGLNVVVTCSGPCSYTLTLGLSAKTAKRYGLGKRATTVGRLTGALLAAGSKTTKLRLTAKARQRLRRAKSVPATLRLTVKNSAGKVTVKTKSITLRP